MRTSKFKTNINCNGCIAKVTPVLKSAEGIGSWGVDINNPDKVLTIETTADDDDNIIRKIEQAGFKIEKLNQQ